MRGVVTMRVGGLALAAIAAGALVSAALAAHAGARAKRSTRIVAASRRTFGEGAWSWFADPRAVYSRGRIVAGWVDRDKYVNIASIKTSSVYRVRIGREQQRDDHGNPALIVRPDGRISAYFSDHNGPVIHWRTTTRPGDIGSWGSLNSYHSNTPGSHGRTYPSPVHLSAERRSWLFWRGGNWSISYARTLSSGNWGHAHELISNPGQRPYLKETSNGRDEIDLAFTNGHPRETPANIYFARYRHRVFYRADGSRITTLSRLPMHPSQADEVYDARKHGGVPAWIHDVAVDSDGNPVLVFATFRDGARHHRYEYARWHGGSWHRHKITDAGGPITTSHFERYYSGGVVLDHRDPSIVYASVKVGSHYEIARFRAKDGGVRWKRQWLTRDSSTDNVRPVVPRGLPKDAQDLLWMRGRYIFYTKFRTSIVGITSGR